MANQWETRYIDIESRAEVGEDKRIRGYPIVFNKFSNKMRTPLGEFREIIRSSAVDRTLRDGIDVRAYINHSPDKILGRLHAGTLRLDKDQHGLRSEISPPNTSYAKDLAVSIRRGDISGMSFRFKLAHRDGDEWRMENGELVRELVDIVIGEVSVVTEPAYPDTEVAIRSLQEFQDTIRPPWKPSADLLSRMLKAKG